MLKFMLALFSAFVDSTLFVLFSESGKLDIPAFTFALKELYNGQKVEKLIYKDHPFFGLLDKDEEFYGKNLPVPVIYGNPQGRSATFSTAQANQTSIKGKEFFLTRVKDYSLATIDNETIESSKADKGAFLKAAETEIDGAMAQITRSLGIALYGDGNGTIGKVSNSGFATTVMTLTNASDIVNFEVGMKLVVCDPATPSTPRSGSLTVVAVDRDTPNVTMSGNLSAGIAAIAQNDLVQVQGDSGLKISGLAAWLPLAAPSATAFFGVDRTADTTRLGGVRMDLRNTPIEEALQKLANRIAREGGAPDVCLMNYDSFLDLELSLGSRVSYADLKVGSEGAVGFRAIVVNGPKGPIKVIADQDCPSDRCYMLTLSTWKLYSLGKAPKMFNGDGLEWIRMSAEDSVEVRIYYYAQLGCRAPGWNGVGQLK